MKIYNDATRAECVDKINRLKLDEPWCIDAYPFTKSRSTAQNSLLYAFLTSIGKQSGEGMQAERNKYKFTIGCNILLADGNNPDFDEFYGKLINNYTYEECVNAMQFISVSSMMKVAQMADYITEIERDAFNRGFHLARPDDYAYAVGEK